MSLRSSWSKSCVRHLTSESMSQDLNRRGRLSLIVCLSAKMNPWRWRKAIRKRPRKCNGKSISEGAEQQSWWKRILWPIVSTIKKCKGGEERERKSLSLSLHFYLSSPPLHFFLALTIGHYILFENACELQRVVLHLEAELMEWTSVCGLPFSVRGNTDKPQLSTFCLV